MQPISTNDKVEDFEESFGVETLFELFGFPLDESCVFFCDLFPTIKLLIQTSVYIVAQIVYKRNIYRHI